MGKDPWTNQEQSILESFSRSCRHQHNITEECANVVDEICATESLYLPIDDIMDEPDEVKDAKNIPNIPQIHKFVRHLERAPCMDFFYWQGSK